ncbi:hypothetical protein BAE44_0009009 [Dichanthelium oligosanthes]|uniref:RPA-interacting protein N-terminal domain-containing protein n=1 Tax=Dichanthelium oligosanthes TaxID=888268 RepID=A0A1E5VXY3_9POAL|nr:hypothetical protein BAE44_0009009 [Dichanthelium oligosanthes]
MDSAWSSRMPIKSHRPDWKSELRTNCMKRVRKDRINLLWKIRAQGRLPANDMKKVESAVKNIISDEIEKLKQTNEGQEDQEMDVIWEYQGPQAAKPAEIESEDILLEMERLLYEDLREELIRKELEALDEEDEYLAQAVLDHMQLNNNGETNCLNLPHQITLEFLRERLANAHMEHFDRGCKQVPKFCLQTMFGLTALYMQCEECSTFDIVV